MAQLALQKLVPEAPLALCQILESSRGQLQPPIRSEIFGPLRFAQHGRSLGETHRATRAISGSAPFLPRLRDNIQALREAHAYIGAQASTGYDISPAAEWLLDNFHLIDTQLEEINEGLPKSYYRSLPMLLDEPLAGLPRIYGVAWAYVAHTDGAFDEDMLVQFLVAYQETRELNLSEMWALPTTLRVVLIENLRRLAERVAANKAAREVANLYSDHIDRYSEDTLNELLALLSLRGVSKVFLGQVAQRLRDRKATGDSGYGQQHIDWLGRKLPDAATVQAQQNADQTADNLSVSNAVTSLRDIDHADWPDIVARTSALMRLMLTCSVFKAEFVATRDQTLHAIERLAQTHNKSELAVAQVVVELTGCAAQSNCVTAAPGHWLLGLGQPELLRKLGVSAGVRVRLRDFLKRIALPLYLSTLVACTSGLIVWLLMPHDGVWPLTAFFVASAVLMFFPASETVVALINRLISESVKPRQLPRLAFATGIPNEHRVLVVIPGMLTSHATIHELLHRMELHFLANAGRNAQFALLTDWADADEAEATSDLDLVNAATLHIRQLNARYPVTTDAESITPRFALLHRKRSFCVTENRWIGWERKRGKLQQLVAALAENAFVEFMDLGEVSRIATGIQYVVTLDSDTQLPPGRLREMVGVAAHPQNRPRIDSTGQIVGGYGILQPRVVAPLATAKDFTLYHWLFSGQCGVDPYSAASSEVYQDVFAEGSFTGKGLLNVQAMHAALTGRIPEGKVLSHDLLEGALARCASMSDITLIEDAPIHSDVAASRIHRWTRGDWQLLPFLLGPMRRRIGAINRWKMFDNLRRSLVAPASLALLLLALSGHALSVWSTLGLVTAAFLAGPMMGAIAAFSPSRDDLSLTYFYRRAAIDLARTLCGALWHLAQLLQHAMMALDAIACTLYRMAISHRNLLQWTTASTAQSQAKTNLSALVRSHRNVSVLAFILWIALLWSGTPHVAVASALCLVWAVSPVWTWLVSRPRPILERAELSSEDATYLEGIARRTWRLFERSVTLDDNNLPPDNLQTTPHESVAHRTSPTNIGLYLLSAACARQFGWIGTLDMVARIEATLASLKKMQRYRGHFLNWYDTQSLSPLTPMYVSTVDSGNLSGHLLAVSQACLEIAESTHSSGAARRAVVASLRRLGPLLTIRRELLPTLADDAAILMLLTIPERLIGSPGTLDLSEQHLSDAAAEIARMTLEQHGSASAQQVASRTELLQMLSDHITMLRSANIDAVAISTDTETSALRARLSTLAGECERIAWEADFSFLYHRKRNLLHIGYRIAEQQLDTSFYDLLASESRLTSLLAIAKGDAPVNHWASLGRPFFAVGSNSGLRSWSGSMFEYLMPGLVLAEPRDSVLRDACLAAIDEQVRYGTQRNVPWGMSESAYAARDETLAFQYAPQGVPRLALRRTPLDEIVVAPYATALAAQLSPQRACANLRTIEKMGGFGPFGFIDALDFSPARLEGADVYMPVSTFMAHHQGMTIVALSNLLLDNASQRWCMANAHIEAVASLLHERAPREVSTLRSLPAAPPSLVLRRRSASMHRELRPGQHGVEPTHVLSNGRYSVTLRPNGAGTSRWGRIGICRGRDDALRDAYGSFFYLRRLGETLLASITHHPARDSAATYKCVYHADRVCFEAAWPDLEAHMTVWVSPEDDVEFRRIELRNLSDQIIDLELMSAFEVTLADPMADEAHPAFSNLFISSEWQDEHEALIFERTPRLSNEQRLCAAHFLTESDSNVVGIRAQTDRQKWLGRNHQADQPVAQLDELRSSTRGHATEANTLLGTGLDPMCALAVQVRIAPNAKAKLTFATAASDDRHTLSAVIDKYRQGSNVQRASLMSATLTGIRLRALRISPDNFSAIQSITTALLLSVTRPHTQGIEADGALRNVCDRRLLWRFGISGDRPIILVATGVPQGLGLLRSLAQALRVFAWGGVACDLVVVNAEPTSYLMPVNRDIAALRGRDAADRDGQPGAASTGFYLLRADELSVAELGTLHALARLRFNADGRPLAFHVQEWNDQHDAALSARRSMPGLSVMPSRIVERSTSSHEGDFDGDTGEFRFTVSRQSRPQRPWVNVLSNPQFGGQVSEAGGGYTWAVNSRLNQLTAWSNDAVSDPPSEWFLLQNVNTLRTWNVTASDSRDAGASYRVGHGQGYSLISHRLDDIDVTASWCVDAELSVKQVRLRMVNRGHKAAQLRVVGMVEWMLGANRADRGTVSTAHSRQSIVGATHQSTLEPFAARKALTCLLATQNEQAAGFGGGTAFFATESAMVDVIDWTCDRREVIDAQGQIRLPQQFGGRSGSGLDPCAALSLIVKLAPGEGLERNFLLGYAANAEAALALATSAAATPSMQRFETARTQWDTLLSKTTVKTPDPLFDALVNRWLIYQTVSCRMWAKAGFYQAGGATGFRDQLQDAMALVWAAPHTLRAQIELCASRQFAEGDVQHWWHAPTGAGVRTHFSDDLLWLPHACSHYLRATGDVSLLDQSVPFLEGIAIPAGAEDAYYVPTVSMAQASVYEHAARAIDHSLRVGVHGLPLMGGGDWNDGMNRVGAEGRGESVWLAWFLCKVVADFSPVARERGDDTRAARWESSAIGWKASLNDNAWDGEWFRRAFFDNGEPLGASHNPEARIDLIAQAWSVLSGAALPEMQRGAMVSVETHLVDHAAGLIKLLDPPLVNSTPSAGYIQAYPPGVRENGGQYSHGAVWALMAQAQLAISDPELSDRRELPYRYFTYLSPAHRSQNPAYGSDYGLEPYVMAGDVYTQAPYAGRGGWSWYTGAAAWMHRAAIESLFGLQQTAETLSFAPCLPAAWQRADLTLTRDEKTMHFVLLRLRTAEALDAVAPLAASVLLPGAPLRWMSLAAETHFVIPLIGHDAQSTATKMQ